MLWAITRSSICRHVADRWHKQYRQLYEQSPGKLDILDRLRALNGTGTPEQINSIIGNNSWTKNYCHECGKDSEILIHLGDAPREDTTWIHVCPDCLKAALAMVETVEPKTVT